VKYALVAVLSLLICPHAFPDVLIFHGTYDKRSPNLAETEPKTGGTYLIMNSDTLEYRFVTYFNQKAWRLKRHEAGTSGTFKRAIVPQRGGRLLSAFSTAAGSDGFGGYVHYMMKLDGIGIASLTGEGFANGYPQTLTGAETRIYGGWGTSAPTFMEQRFHLRFQKAASLKASAEGKTFDEAVRAIRDMLTAKGYEDGLYHR
jgi:hypothetical protein